jgi:hypothetical protein
MLELDQSIRTRGHTMKLYCKHSNTRLQNNFFPNTVVGLGNSLSKGAVSIPSVEAFKGAVDNDWSSKPWL